MQDEDAGDRDDARRHRRAERPGGEIALEVGVAEAARVADQEDRGEVGAGGDEQRRRSAARRVQPARDRIALRVADRHAPGGDRADHGAHEERRQHRRERERARRRGAAPRSLAATPWKAKPAPRSTIPRAARLSGMNSVDMIDAKASENAVHSTTSTKISQTWFASQTGPIAQAIRARGTLAALAAAGHQRPEPGAEVGPAEHGVEGHADPEHGRDGVGGAQAGSSESSCESGRGP